MNKLTLILAALVVALSILLGVSLKSGFEKSAKIDQLQDTIKGLNKAETVIYKIKKIAVNDDCFNKEIPEEILKEIRK